MKSQSLLAVTFTFAAIGITTAMDATGLFMFSALPLFPLMGALWYFGRVTRREVGLRWGRTTDYRFAILYPLVVMSIIVGVAAVSGSIDMSETEFGKASLNLLIISLSTVIVSIITEEGFFRGALWASLVRAGWRREHVILWTSISFSLWHVSAVTLTEDFAPPPLQIPLYLVNAAVIGGIWAILRLRSGSVIVSSVSHGVWNGLAYVLFGFGTTSGALGITNTGVFGPEIGFLGLGLNLIVVIWLWRGKDRSEHATA